MTYGQSGGPEEITVSLGPSHRIVPLQFTGITTTTSKVILNGLGFLLGWSARETTGTAAVQAQLVDGGDANGPPLGYPGALSNGSDTHWFGPQGIPITTALYLKVISGTCDITIWARREDAPLQAT